MRTEVIGECTLYLGDCRNVDLPRDAAIVSDPPYGIGYQRGGGGGGGKSLQGGKVSAHAKFAHAEKPIQNDDRPFDPTPWLAFAHVIMWGANHYAKHLPHGRWLAWNKLGDMEPWDDFCDVEFAWQNKRAADRIFSLMWKGLIRDGEKERRVHQTQKPIGLMRWCIEQLPASCDLIIDPYMGSGTTGVAAIKAGRRFIGIEIDPGHFETACKRIRAAYAQPDLFVTASPAPKPVQEALL